jgi:hypothetical protein
MTLGQNMRSALSTLTLKLEYNHTCSRRGSQGPVCLTLTFHPRRTYNVHSACTRQATFLSSIPPTVCLLMLSAHREVSLGYDNTWYSLDADRLNQFSAPQAYRRNSILPRRSLELH